VSFIALLDANVLWPAALRCILVRAALRGLFRPVWTERILEEMAHSLQREGRAHPDRIARTVRLMKESVPHALVEGYETLIPVMQNDPKDRHVLAAAVRAGAGTIVTNNVRDFPNDSRVPYDMAVHTPDEFLLDLLDLNQTVMAEVLVEQAAQLRRPPMTTRQVVEGMARLVPDFCETVLASGLVVDEEAPFVAMRVAQEL
jgi:predicted nucleic acid-binding protein